MFLNIGVRAWIARRSSSIAAPFANSDLLEFAVDTSLSSGPNPLPSTVLPSVITKPIYAIPSANPPSEPLSRPSFAFTCWAILYYRALVGINSLWLMSLLRCWLSVLLYSLNDFGFLTLWGGLETSLVPPLVAVYCPDGSSWISSGMCLGQLRELWHWVPSSAYCLVRREPLICGSGLCRVIVVPLVRRLPLYVSR